jgi:hypothetical protein
MTKRRATLLIMVVILAATAIGSVLIRLLSQPASGTITSQTQQAASSQYYIDLVPKPISGKYVALDYPAGLTPKTPDSFATPELEEFEFTAKDTTSWLLAVDISQPRAGLLTNDSGYAYRLSHPKFYQASQTTANGQTVIIMADRSANFNQVAYVMHGPLLATIALSGGDAAGLQPLQTTLNMVLSALRWL